MYVSGKSRYKDLEEVDAVLCQPCQERNQSTRSNGFCAQCREHMCVTCFETHKQFKLNRGHSLADGNDASVTVEQNEDLQKCDQHFNELVKFYCPVHKQVGCGDCMILEHKACKVEYIRDKARKFADSLEFKGLVNDADKCLSQCKETATSIKNNKVQVSDISEKFIKDVEMFSESLISQINKMKNSMIKQANMVRSKDLETLEELERENEVLMEDISSLAELLKSQIEQPRKLFVSYVIKKPRLKQLEETHSKLEKQNSLKNYQFNQNCNLEQAVKETSALGSLQEIKIQNDEADDGSGSDVGSGDEIYNGSESDVSWDEDEAKQWMERHKKMMELDRRDPQQKPRALPPLPGRWHVPVPSEPPVGEGLFYEEQEVPGVPEVRSRHPSSDIRGRPPLPVPSEDSSDEEEDEDPDLAMKPPPLPPGPGRQVPPPIFSIPKSHNLGPEEPSPLDSYQLLCRNVKVNGEYLSYVDNGKGDVGLFVFKNIRKCEIEIIDKGQRGMIVVGGVPKNYPENCQPGWKDGSIGYHADDGNLYHGRGSGRTFGPERGDKDRISIALGPSFVIFSRNSNQVGNVRCDSSKMFPAIGFHSPGEVVKVIMGSLRN